MPYTPGKFSRLAFEPQKIRPKKQIEIRKIIGKTFHRPVTSGPPIAVQFSRVDLMGIVLGQPWSRSISAKQCALIRMISKTSWGKKIASPPGIRRSSTAYHRINFLQKQNQLVAMHWLVQQQQHPHFWLVVEYINWCNRQISEPYLESEKKTQWVCWVGSFWRFLSLSPIRRVDRCFFTGGKHRFKSPVKF